MALSTRVGRGLHASDGVIYGLEKCLPVELNGMSAVSAVK